MYYPTKDEFIKEFDFSNPIRIGQGAFGKVFQLRCKQDGPNLQSGKDYAAKQIEVLNEQMFNKIQNEFKINQLISKHPNVIYVSKVYAWQEILPQKFCLCFIMELADRSLQKEIINRKQTKQYFTAFQLLEFFKKCIITFKQLIEEKQIYHRDIKPENILLIESEGLQPKITDFGVSKSLHELNLQESLKNTLVGTPVYFSPILWNAFVNRTEQPKIFDKIKHDLEKSDIFSLGLTFLQCALLLTTEIVGLNIYENSNRKNMLLDKIENERIRNIITDMLQYEENNRKSYQELIDNYFKNQKGIFEESPIKQMKIKQIHQIVCLNHPNCKAQFYCFQFSIAGYCCDICQKSITQYCIPLPEKSEKISQNQKETLEEYFEQTIKILFIKVIKDQINYYKQKQEDATFLENNINIVYKAFTMRTHDQITIQLRQKLDEVRIPYKKLLDLEQYNEALQFLDSEKEKICQLICDLVQSVDKINDSKQNIKQKKKIFDSTTLPVQNKKLM